MALPLLDSFNIIAGVPIESSMQVADLTERDSIPSFKRWEGMFTYVISEGKFYSLIGGITNSDWVEWSFGGGTSYIFTDGLNENLGSVGLGGNIENKEVYINLFNSSTQKGYILIQSEDSSNQFQYNSTSLSDEYNSALAIGVSNTRPTFHIQTSASSYPLNSFYFDTFFDMSHNSIELQSAGDIRLSSETAINILPVSDINLSGNNIIAAPSNLFEITSSTPETSGLRFTNLTSSSPTSAGQPIGVDANGDVITLNIATINSTIDLNESYIINGQIPDTYITTPITFQLDNTEFSPQIYISVTGNDGLGLSSITMYNGPDIGNPLLNRSIIELLAISPDNLSTIEISSNEAYITASYLQLSSSLPVYADNAAAAAAGLNSGQVYRTSTGDLKIRYL